MKKNPKISVIMSVYNGMPYLEEAARSILHQTYKNFEFIIVDDASKDKSWQFVRNLKDKRIKVIRNKKNLGLAASLNLALRLAQSDFIARMDADDISLSKRLETQLAFMLKNPKIDICGTWVDLINKKGQIIGEKKYPTTDYVIKKALAWYSPIIHPTLMVKSKVFNSLSGFDTNFDMAEDYELLMRAKTKFKMANIPQKLLLWRVWNKRRSSAHWDKMERVDLRIKFEAFKRGDFGLPYFIVVISKFIITYAIPYKLKLYAFKFLKLI